MSLKSIPEDPKEGEEMMHNDLGGGADSSNEQGTKRQGKDAGQEEEESDYLEDLHGSNHQSSKHGNDYSSVESLLLEEESLHQQQQLASLPELGPGPARFEPNGRTLEEQISDLSDHDKDVVASLKLRWEQTYPEVPFTDRMYLQFARFSITGESSRCKAVRTLKKTKKVAAATSNTSSSVSGTTSSSNKRRWRLGGLMKRRGKGTGNNHENKDITATEDDVEVEGNIANDAALVDGSTLLTGSSSHKQHKRSKKPNLFNERGAWEAMNNFDHRYLSLTVEALDTQLRSKTLFPVPGLKGLKSCSHHRHSISKKGGHHTCCQELPMFYMRPSRYFPNSTPIEDVIDNLAYVMQTMTCSDEGAQSNGIGFLANMDGWTFQNFSVEYCSAFMSMLQGHVIPVHVELFLIVDPPTWFPAIWKIMKPMLSGQFRRKVKMIPSSELGNYLCEGYEKFLPDEIHHQEGQAKTTDIVRDFITYRQHVEELDDILAASNDAGEHSCISLPSSSKDPVPELILTTSKLIH